MNNPVVKLLLRSRQSISGHLNQLSVKMLNLRQQRLLHSLRPTAGTPPTVRMSLLQRDRFAGGVCLQQRRGLIEVVSVSALALLAVGVEVTMLPLTLRPARINAKRCMMKDRVSRTTKAVMDKRTLFFLGLDPACQEALKNPELREHLEAQLLYTIDRIHKVYYSAASLQNEKAAVLPRARSDFPDINDWTIFHMKALLHIYASLEYNAQGYSQSSLLRAYAASCAGQLAVWLCFLVTFRSSALVNTTRGLEIFSHNGDISLAWIHLQELLSVIGVPLAIAAAFSLQASIAIKTWNASPKYFSAVIQAPGAVADFLRSVFSSCPGFLLFLFHTPWFVSVAPVLFGGAVGAFALALPEVAQLYVLFSALATLGRQSLFSWPAFYERFWKLSAKERDGIIDFESKE